jgi:hypothetical protein
VSLSGDCVVLVLERFSGWILPGYLALFFTVVSFYDTNKDNTLEVILAAAITLITGRLAWV